MAESQGLLRETFSKLSPHPYLLASLRGEGPTASPSRANHREPAEARPPHINASTLTHAHGSALVRIGNNTAICGIRGEILPTANIPNYRAADRELASASVSELRDYDLLVPNIELATGSAPQFLPGAPPTTLAQTLSTRVYSLLHSSKLIDTEDLRIWHTRPVEEAEDDSYISDEEKKTDEAGEESSKGERVVIAYWVLHIDIFFISYDGSPFDVAWASLLAALRNTKLPATRWDPDRELVICSRQDRKPLTLSGFPIACTAAIFKERETELEETGEFYALVDPDSREEELCHETITAVVDRSSGETSVLSISKHGGSVLQPKTIKAFILVAGKRWEEFKKAMD
ncbi:exosome complex exonuclease RRP43 [Plectosphaerella cucumerina]|uniref:Ribosomal RNA-processing protein 43 n=1 Tax=Plectosphaerella cucumerina TaxID=40658 RepID=A0A8K0X3N9_9PEZI|nr:exosome complex exonuclease RRP43 [Plectosphaerella cucumerina]